MILDAAMNTKKRPKKDNGDGNIRERKDGTWEARLTIDYETKSLYGKTKAEVKRKLKEYKRLKARGYQEVKKITINEYVANWLSTYKKGVVKDSTYDRMESTFIHHIKPTIGHRQMGSIDSMDIQKMINEKVNPSNKNNNPLSKSSVKKIMELLNLCFEFAVEHGDLNNNPIRFVRIPNYEQFITKTKEMFTFSDDDLIMFKNVADEKRINGEPFSPQITRDKYIHVIKEQEINAINMLNVI